MTSKPLPILDPGSQPFWSALQEGRFLLKTCRSCGKAHFYPREVCPHCFGADLEWREASGRGTIYSYTIAVRPAGPMFEADAPYAVILVDLDEGPRMMSRVVARDREGLRIGARVRLEPVAETDGFKLPFFALAEEARA